MLRTFVEGLARLELNMAKSCCKNSSRQYCRLDLLSCGTCFLTYINSSLVIVEGFAGETVRTHPKPRLQFQSFAERNMAPPPPPHKPPTTTLVLSISMELVVQAARARDHRLTMPHPIASTLRQSRKRIHHRAVCWHLALRTKVEGCFIPRQCHHQTIKNP